MCLTQFLKIQFFAHFCMSDQEEMKKKKVEELIPFAMEEKAES